MAEGIETRVNTTITSHQTAASVAALSNGGYVVTWLSGSSIFSQSYGVDGLAAGGETRVVTASGARVTGLNDGGHVVTWLANDSIFAQRYDDSGAAVTSATRVSTSTAYAQSAPSVATLDNGDLMFTWQSNNQDGSGYGVFAQRLDANLRPIGVEITGTSGADKLYGGEGSQTLLGGEGNDLLKGGAGRDVLIGGAGNDLYFIDDLVDIIEETGALASEVDTVQATVTYRLGANVENLLLTGGAAINGEGNALDNKLTGNAMANTLTGGAGNDTLIGAEGADSMSGGLGNDTYYVDNAGDTVVESSDSVHGGVDTVISTVSRTLGSYQENLTLAGSGAINGTGNTLGNVLKGNNANNVLDAKAGIDTLYGYNGNDTYYVDHAGDTVVESADAVNGGVDTVISSVSRTLGLYQENLTLSGSAALSGTGNALNNKLTGNAGNNVLDGAAGVDLLYGGLGNDTYRIDNAGDYVGESSDAVYGGIDTIISSVSRTLGNFVENLTLSGSDAIKGTGNALDNKLVGNAANNLLNGAGGADVLTGGGGLDIFDFNAINEMGATASTRDVITDFVRTEDIIDLSSIDANSTTAANDAFSAVFVSSFTAAGQLKFAGGVLYGNTDSNLSTHEFAIALTGIGALSAADFLL